MTSDRERIDILVLGLGNVLCGDDGVGVIAVHRIRRELVLPDRVRVIDGGTLGLDLLALVSASDRVILVDAVRGDGPPGTLVRISGDEVAPAVHERLSPHQVGVADLLAGAALCAHYPGEVVITGIIPATTDLQVGCTPPVAEQIGALIDSVIAELRRWGVEPVRRDASAQPRDGTRGLGLW
jgi:hydrogenase maturation protease